MLQISLLVAGVVLLLVSLFLKDSAEKERRDLEQSTLALYQDIASLKNRVKLMEEELMVAGALPSTAPSPAEAKPVHDIIRSQIFALSAKGYSLEEISRRSSLAVDDVRAVLAGGR